MNKIGAWFSSFAIAVLLAFFGAEYALFQLSHSHDHSFDLGVILYPLIASPLLIIAHAAIYASLKEKMRNICFPIFVSAFVAPVIYSLGVYLIAKARGYN
jgi:hypothetical protein